MSVWNKYGTMTEGRVTANLRMTGPDIYYDACRWLYNQEPVGNKEYRPAQAAIVNGVPMVVIDGAACGYLPTDWTQFVGAIKQRGPLNGIGTLLWRQQPNGQWEFAVFIDLKDA